MHRWIVPPLLSWHYPGLLRYLWVVGVEMQFSRSSIVGRSDALRMSSASLIYSSPLPRSIRTALLGSNFHDVSQLFWRGIVSPPATPQIGGGMEGWGIDCWSGGRWLGPGPRAVIRGYLKVFLCPPSICWMNTRWSVVIAAGCWAILVGLMSP